MGFFRLAAAALGLSLAFSGCASAYRQSLGASEGEIYTRIYLTDFNQAWQSTLDALKASPMDITNREGGFLQSKWVDNTAQKNFTESFGQADTYQKAQYRFRVTVAKGFYNGRPSVKVAVQKEQLVQRDVLEGFHTIETDGIDERTLLYRIGRIIFMRTRIAALEEEKIRKNLENTGGGVAPAPGAGATDSNSNPPPPPSTGDAGADTGPGGIPNVGAPPPPAAKGKSFDPELDDAAPPADTGPAPPSDGNPAPADQDGGGEIAVPPPPPPPPGR